MIPKPASQRRKQIRNQPVIITCTRATEWEQGARYRFECAINDLARAVALSLAEKQQQEQPHDHESPIPANPG